MNIKYKLQALIFVLCSTTTHCAWHLGPQCAISNKTVSVGNSQDSNQRSRVVYDLIFKNHNLQPFTLTKNQLSQKTAEQLQSTKITTTGPLSAGERLKIVQELQNLRKTNPDRKTLVNLAIIGYTEKCKNAIKDFILDPNISTPTAMNLSQNFAQNSEKNNILIIYEIKDQEYGPEVSSKDQHGDIERQDRRAITIHEIAHALASYGDDGFTPHYVSLVKRRIKGLGIKCLEEDTTIDGQYVSIQEQNTPYKDIIPLSNNYAKTMISGIIGQQICESPCNNSQRKDLYTGTQLCKQEDILALVLDERTAAGDAKALKIVLKNIHKISPTFDENTWSSRTDVHDNYHLDDSPVDDSPEIVKEPSDNIYELLKQGSLKCQEFLNEKAINTRICELYRDQYYFLVTHKNKLLEAAEKYKDQKIIPCSELYKYFGLDHKKTTPPKYKDLYRAEMPWSWS